MAMDPSRGGIESRQRRLSLRRGGPRPSGITIALALSIALGFGGRPAEGQGPCPSRPARPETKNAEKIPALLRDIFKEVLELGPYPGEELVRREFFVGEGDDDTYKDYHLVVLIHDVPGGQRMILQVTRLVPDPNNPRIKHGRDAKMIVCRTNGDRLDIVKSDYADKELSSFLPELLRAIRDRKKLMRDKS
jgi:hypothetical protein